MTPDEKILSTARDSGIISSNDLASILNTAPSKIKLIDATYPLNTNIPMIGNAVGFDIDDIADPNSQMAHMLPSVDLFAQKVSALGISNDDFVIVYDHSGFIMAASRVWWMFRVFGHNNVAVLDGGLVNWTQKGLPVQSSQRPTPQNFTATFHRALVLSYDDMKLISETKSRTVLDARPPERFVDHIPNSQNLPALALVDASRHIITPSIFDQLVQAQDIDLDSKPLAATCGSGVTACSITLTLFRKGYKNVPVYDGSWTEWSSRK